MFTKEFQKDVPYSGQSSINQQTSRFASLVSLIKKLDRSLASPIPADRIEKEIRYSRQVDIGNLIRGR